MKIATFNPISNGALQSKELPLTIKVLDFGKTETLDDPIFLDKKAKKTFSAMQKKIGRERVPIDFNHNTVPGSNAYEEDKEPRRIAGYGTPVVKDDGLWLEEITWTPTGESAARDFEDISPAPLLDDENNVIGLHSIALCPAGAISDLHFYSATITDLKKSCMKLSTDEKETELAKVKPQTALGRAEHGEFCECTACTSEVKQKIYAKTSLSADSTSVKTMSAVAEPKAYVTEPENTNTFRKNMDEKLKKFASEMDLPENEEHQKKLEALVAEWKGAQKVAAPITGDPVPAQFSAMVQELNARIKTLETDRNENLARFTAMEKAEIISIATKNGKVVPFSAEEVAELSSKTLKSIIDKLPANVPLVSKTRVLSADAKPEKRTMADSARAIQEQVDAVLANS